MLYKRLIALAAGCVLFLISFIVYSEVSHNRMEDQFRAEREKFHVDHLNLTAADTGTPVVAPAMSLPAAAPATDTNVLIGPVPPPTSATPDSGAAPSGSDTNSTSAPATDTNSAPSDSSTPAPAPADTNSTPAPMPSSTMNDRRERSPFQLASYRPSEATDLQIANPAVGVIANAPGATAAVPEPASAVASPAKEPAAVPATSAPAASRTTGTSEGSVIVLLYHQFKPAGVAIPSKFQWTLNVDVFESEMKYIHDHGYHVVSLADVLRFLNHEITLPPGSVCITIDDGYKSAVELAAPILKKYGYPWTFYVYPQFITTAEGPGAASWNDLLQLQADGVDIECHSMTHPKLSSHHQQIKGVWHNLSPEEYDEWLKNETAGAKAILEEKMGKPITSFAYPFGDYNKTVEAAVLAAGFKSITTVAGNPIHSTTSPYSIGRYTITQAEVKNFESDLRQGALGFGDVQPPPGATISDPRPVISAVLGYSGTIDPNTIETSVYDLDVRHDFDPRTNMIRLYLLRDLIKSVVPVNIRVKDATTGQVMVAKWHFNYQPAAGAVTAPHAPIMPGASVPAATATVQPAAKSTPPNPRPVDAVSPH